MPFRRYYHIFVWPMLVLTLHGLVTVFHVYDTLPWFDTVLHFLGGFSIALGVFYFFEHLEAAKELQASARVKVILTFALTALAATLWELFEFDLTALFGWITQPSVYDTTKDLAMGLLGATLVSIRYWR